MRDCDLLAVSPGNFFFVWDVGVAPMNARPLSGELAKVVVE